MDKTFITLISIIAILGAGIIYFMSGNLEGSAKKSSAGLSSNNQTNLNIQNMNIEILQQGEGDQAKSGDRIKVNYVGTLENGTKFDSSIDRGQPFVFSLGQNSVIKGWELGVEGMKVGEKRKLTIPPELGYGARGAGDIIPPNSTLIFEIDLLEIIK